MNIDTLDTRGSVIGRTVRRNGSQLRTPSRSTPVAAIEVDSG
jgi:hypothetical protein